MKKKYYFESDDSKMCYTEAYFIDKMKEQQLKQMSVIVAIPLKYDGSGFWCKENETPGEDSKDSCGKQCLEYKPKNGKNGCCKHFSTKLYEMGEETTLYC